MSIMRVSPLSSSEFSFTDANFKPSLLDAMTIAASC